MRHLIFSALSSISNSRVAYDVCAPVTKPWVALVQMLAAAAFCIGPSHVVAAQPAEPNGNLPTVGQSTESMQVAHPKEWAEFLVLHERLQRYFQDHIRGATNITVPMATKEFKWRVNWKAQQAYCKDLAQAIFSRSPRVTYPLPDVIAARDGALAVHDAIGKTFPRCPKYEPGKTDPLQSWVRDANRQLRGQKPVEELPTRKAIDREQSYWDINRKTFLQGAQLTTGYFFGIDYLLSIDLQETFVDDERKDRSEDWLPSRPAGVPAMYVSADRHAHRLNGCPEDRNSMSAPNIEPTSWQAGSQFMPAQVIKFDGIPAMIEFGTYPYNGYKIDSRQELFPALERWGLKGQRFLFVRPMHHDLWRDWAVGGQPKNFEHKDENHRPDGLYRACVINFDSIQSSSKQ